MQKRKRFLARFREGLDLPSEALPGGFSITLSGGNELSVWGCREILKYGDEEIVLALFKASLAIRGRGLLCVAFDAGCVRINGRICALQLYGEGKNAD